MPPPPEILSILSVLRVVLRHSETVLSLSSCGIRQILSKRNRSYCLNAYFSLNLIGRIFFFLGGGEARVFGGEPSPPPIDTIEPWLEVLIL